MRPSSIAFAILAVIGFPLGSDAGETALTPIIVEILQDHPDRPTINNREFSMPEAVQWLKETSDKFGRADPIVIKLHPGGDIAAGVFLLQAGRHSHDNVYLAVPKNGNPRSGFTLLSMARDEMAMQLEKQLPSIQPVSPAILPLGDGPDPNKAGGKQFNRLEKIQKGELP
jgi:hypothetical protein